MDFEVFQPSAFERWAPNPIDYHDVHSIWFEVLGEHGYVGLLLYVVLWILAWRLAGRLIKIGRQHAELEWAANLCAMIRSRSSDSGSRFVSRTGLCDVPYLLIAILVLTNVVAQKEFAARKAQAAPKAPSPYTFHRATKLPPQLTVSAG